MYLRAVTALLISTGLVSTGAITTSTAIAHADEPGYSTCMTNRAAPLGTDVPANLGSWIDLGRKVDQNVNLDGASPQSQLEMVESIGWNHVIAGAIVQCALTNSPV